MALPYGLGTPSLEMLTEQQNSDANDWEVVPEACKVRMADNGDGTWSVPQISGACVPSILYTFWKNNKDPGSARSPDSVKKEDYPWHREGWESDAISKWYVNHVDPTDDATVVRHFIQGIAQREGWVDTPTPVRSIEEGIFTIPDGAEVPQSGTLPGTVFDTAGDTFAALNKFIDPANIIRYGAIIVGVGLILFSARKVFNV